MYAIYFMFAGYITLISFIFAKSICTYQDSKYPKIVRLTCLISTLIYGSFILFLVFYKYFYLLLE